MYIWIHTIFLQILRNKLRFSLCWLDFAANKISGKHLIKSVKALVSYKIPSWTFARNEPYFLVLSALMYGIIVYIHSTKKTDGNRGNLVLE